VDDLQQAGVLPVPDDARRPHAGLMRLCSMDPGEQARIVRRLLDDDGVAVSGEGR
jgi:hypothetical protein